MVKNMKTTSERVQERQQEIAFLYIQRFQGALMCMIKSLRPTDEVRMMLHVAYAQACAITEMIKDANRLHPWLEAPVLSSAVSSLALMMETPISVDVDNMTTSFPVESMHRTTYSTMQGCVLRITTTVGDYKVHIIIGHPSRYEETWMVRAEKPSMTVEVSKSSMPGAPSINVVSFSEGAE